MSKISFKMVEEMQYPWKYGQSSHPYNMPNSWSKQAYVQGVYCGSVSFKKDVNMFERMEIAESIYEGVVTPSYKKTTQ